MKKIVFTVTNDLSYDQRMQRICTTLSNAGYDVTLVGRLKKDSVPLKKHNFNQVRLKCFFHKGKLFYLELNLRLLFYLLKNKFDIIGSIDLDTILPGFIVARYKKILQIYDAHEYFPELEEVVHRPFVKKIWQKIEEFTVPKIPYGYTVSQNIKEIFKEKYNVDYELVRNISVLREIPEKIHKYERTIIYQGAVNYGRGLEETILAMHHVDATFLICGKGDVYEDLQELVKQEQLQDKVVFKGYLQPDELRQETLKATFGITFFKDAGLSNKYSLANRFFDYIHAGIPQLTVNLPEYERFNKEFEVSLLVDNLTPEEIARKANILLNNNELYNRLKENTLKARKVYNWQQEEKKLLNFYQNLPV
ncbi:MAG: glycosyltransferase [Bacteroidetes bacterium]|nr:MAG: glycosyltransferase [Bacteroidota bacterium]